MPTRKEELAKAALRHYGVRMDDDGRWITTENDHHVHINEEGEPDIGNPHVIKAMKGEGGSKTPNDSGENGKAHSAPKAKSTSKQTSIGVNKKLSSALDDAIYDQDNKAFTRITEGLEGGDSIESDYTQAVCKGGKLYSIIENGTVIDERVPANRVMEYFHPDDPLTVKTHMAGDPGSNKSSKQTASEDLRWEADRSAGRFTDEHYYASKKYTYASEEERSRIRNSFKSYVDDLSEGTVLEAKNGNYVFEKKKNGKWSVRDFGKNAGTISSEDVAHNMLYYGPGHSGVSQYKSEKNWKKLYGE